MSKVKIKIICIYMLLFISNIFAEEKEKWKPTNVTVAYFSELLANPGLIAGTEYTLKKSGKHELNSNVNLGFYSHYRNTTALFIDTDLGYRFTLPVGLTFQASAGIGYIHSFLGAEEYEITDGELEKVKDFGTPGLMPSITLGLGWDLRKNKIAPINTFIKCKIFGRYPYVGMMVPQLGISIGGTYYF